MNSANTETLKLYKNRYLYNGSRYMFYHDARDYETWLVENSDGVPYSKTVFYKSISEPIDINESIKNCDEYTYGSITNDGKTYYFFVDDISTDAYLRTTIHYTIDWWATNWYTINCTKSHVTRYSGKRPGYMKQPFDAYTYTFTEVENLKSGNIYPNLSVKQGLFIFTYIQPDESEQPKKMRFGAFEITDQTIQCVMEGTWQEKCGIPDGNIYCISVIPLMDESMLTGWSQSPLTLQIPYKYFDISNGATVPDFFVAFDEPIRSTEQEIQGICDWYGLQAWECPIDVTIYGFYVVLEIGATSCLLRFLPMTEPILSTHQPDKYFGSEMTGKGFCYQCRQATLFEDKKTEYDWRDRSYDKLMTQIQAEKDVISSYSSMIENIGFGMAFGNWQGGVAAGLGGLVEEVSTAYLHKEYDPKILDATRQHYARMKDVMAVVGDAITDLWHGQNSTDNKAYMVRFKKVMDDATKELMNSDINTNGYYCDEITPDLNSYFGIGKIIVADNTVVEGACNTAGKQQVVYRLQNGVEFK